MNLTEGIVSPNDEKRRRVDTLRAKLHEQQRVVDEIREQLVSTRTTRQSSPLSPGSKSLKYGPSSRISFPNTPSVVPATPPGSRYARDGATHSSARAGASPSGAFIATPGAVSPTAPGQQETPANLREHVRILAETQERDHDLDVPYETAVPPSPPPYHPFVSPFPSPTQL